MSQQKAVLANTTNAVHRNAYNAAFYELGLGWHWDAATYDQLLPLDCKACTTWRARARPNSGDSSGAVTKSLPDCGNRPNFGLRFA